MAGYATGTAKEPEEEEEEENVEGNHKQPETNPIGGSHGWAKESVKRERSEMAGNLAMYATGISKDPREEKEEENAVGNHKQPARNPVGGSHVWGNENAPTFARSTLGIHGGAEGGFTKHATKFSTEVNTPSA